ncbi:ECF transporter S component [Garciella nitratireducens]|uniref:ECF transporter S component n=1 Tax=Garciella nitratireducens TaxID=218205 RepID=UPI000E07FD9F|nr:ECF transporter S component [Garciella nitratireducens]RBP42288.1 putative membrane protein [Garciella nitratireducens]
MNTHLKKITHTSLLIALVFLCTVVIIIPSPLGGYINLGDAAIYLSSYFLGPMLGFLAAGIGSMLGDFYLGYVNYMIATLLIKGTMGLISGYLFQKEKYILGSISGLMIMVIGYYIFEIILFHNLLSPLANIPYNLIQGIIGVVVGILLIKMFKNAKVKISL